MIFIKKKIVVITLVIGVIVTCAFGGVYATARDRVIDGNYQFPTGEQLRSWFYEKNDANVDFDMNCTKYMAIVPVNTYDYMLVTSDEPFVFSRIEKDQKGDNFYKVSTNSDSCYSWYLFKDYTLNSVSKQYGASLDVKVDNINHILINHKVMYKDSFGQEHFFPLPQFNLGGIMKAPLKTATGDFLRTCGILVKIGVGILATFLVIGLIKRIIFWGL